MASIASVLNSVIRNAEQAVTEQYAAKLRDHAQSYGWPDEISSQLSMSYDGSNHSITYPEDIADDILTLEYGTQDIPPSPALRTFMTGGL